MPPSESAGSGDSDDEPSIQQAVRKINAAAVARAAELEVLLPSSALLPGGQSSLEVEPAWQRVPGRWEEQDAELLMEMKVILAEDLRQSPPFPEVVGQRCMLRFLRGHKRDVGRAAAMMARMLQWRRDNGVDAIRQDIVLNKLYHPSLFPFGETVMKHYPFMMASPLCTDAKGNPLSYEGYSFSPRLVQEELKDIDHFIVFHIYCQEWKQMLLNAFSDERERQALEERQRRRNGAAASPAANGRAAAGAAIRPSDSRGKFDPIDAPATCAGRDHSCDATVNSDCDDGAGNGGGNSSSGGGEATWGQIVRNTIIRDLSGFGLEHAGPTGREIIRKVMEVSQDNYPEMMEACYMVNVPWVFFALWKGMKPLMSANTVRKVHVLGYQYMAVLTMAVPLDRLPVRVGGCCDPDAATPEQVEEFLLRGRAPGDGGAAAAASAEAGAGAAGTATEGTAAQGGSGGGGAAAEGQGESERVPQFWRRRSTPGAADGAAALPPPPSSVSPPPAHLRPLGTEPGMSMDGAVAALAAAGVGGAGLGSFGSGAIRAQGSEEYQQYDTVQVEEALQLSIQRKRSRLSLARRTAEEAAAAAAGGAAGEAGRSVVPTIAATASATAGECAESEDGSQLSDAALEEKGWLQRRFLAMRRRQQQQQQQRRLREQALAADAGASAGSSTPPTTPPGMALAAAQLPLEITTESLRDWVDNSARDQCLLCDRVFSLVSRKHHCRICGEIVCGRCSAHRARLRLDGPESLEGLSFGVRRKNIKQLPVRICNDCHYSLSVVTVAPTLDAAGAAAAVAVVAPDGAPDAAAVNTNSGPARARPIAGRASLSTVRAAAAAAVVEEPLGPWALDGDVVLADVVQWDRVRLRAEVVVGYLWMCVAAVAAWYGMALWRWPKRAVEAGAAAAWSGDWQGNIIVPATAAARAVLGPTVSPASFDAALAAVSRGKAFVSARLVAPVMFYAPGSLAAGAAAVAAAVAATSTPGTATTSGAALTTVMGQSIHPTE